MAALPDRYEALGCTGGTSLDLRDLQPEHLAPLLEEEEIEAWRTGLDWDFQTFSQLVKRFVQSRALNGFALLETGAGGTRVAGYSYYVAEEGKGLIGDFYVRHAARTVANENRLMEAVLTSMWRNTPGMRRVEAQMLMLSSHVGRPLPMPPVGAECSRRHFPDRPRRRRIAAPRAARIIHSVLDAGPPRIGGRSLSAAAYRGHVGDRINDQYLTALSLRSSAVSIKHRAVPWMRLVLFAWVFAARDRSTGTLCGISLASMVAPDVANYPAHHRSNTSGARTGI